MKAFLYNENTLPFTLKQHMKTIYITLLLLFAVSAPLLFTSCTKIDCSGTPPSETTHHRLEPNELQKVPYSGSDTLYFLTKQGDTCIVRGTGKRHYENQTSHLAGTLDCGPTDYDIYQAYNISYTPVMGGMELVLTQEKKEETITIDLKNGPSFSFRYERMDNKDDAGRIDSLEINHIMYYDVYPSYIYDNLGNQDNNYKALFNKSEGILYLKSDKDNIEFSIVKKP